MITQEDVNSYAKAMKWGCLVPIAIFIVIFYLYTLFGREKTGFVPEAGIHYKIKYTGECDTTEGKRVYQATLYFSRTDSFVKDYIEFNYTPVTGPKIYFIEPDTFYIIDENSFYIRDIAMKQFNIVYINHLIPPAITKLPCDSGTYYTLMRALKKKEQEDSIIDSKSDYTFELKEYANGFSVFDKQGKLILSD